jgi:hypothetical protein
MLLAFTLAPQLLPAPAAAAALLPGPAAAAAAAGCGAAVRDRSMVSGLLHTGQVACLQNKFQQQMQQIWKQTYQQIDAWQRANSCCKHTCRPSKQTDMCSC